MINKHFLKWCVVVMVGGLWAGCASTNVTLDSNYAGRLPRPAQVLVYDFAVSPDEVELNSGLAADVENLVKKTPRTDQERAIGRQVAAALSTHLVREIQALGFPASRVPATTVAGANTLSIKGEFISIDEGNQTERVVVGLGLGRTDVRAVTQVYELDAGTNILVSQFGITAKSGSSPGMVETLGVGAVTGHLVTSAVVSTGVQVGTEVFSANVEADADRTAKAIANELKKQFIAHGWISE